jgi:hypothetical protein
MQGEWDRFGEKAEAIKALREAMRSEQTIHELYPYETKFLELSHIGYEHGTES